MSKRKNSREVRRRAYVEDSSTGDYIRSRTISGFTPSATESNAQVLERRAARKKVNRRHRTTIVSLSLMVVIGVGLYLFSQFTPSIGGVEYENSMANISSEGYVATADQYLSEHPSERFSWSLKRDLFSEYFIEKHPEVEIVKIKSQLIDGATLQLKFREPVAVWRASNHNYFVDKDGYVFENNFFSLPDIEILDKSGSGIDSGGIASRRLLEFVGQVISGLNASGVGKVQSITIPAAAIRYVEIRLDGYNFPIKAQTDRDATEQVQDIISMMEYLKAKDITPQNYVDTRVKNRGFWK